MVKTPEDGAAAAARARAANPQPVETAREPARTVRSRRFPRPARRPHNSTASTPACSSFRIIASKVTSAHQQLERCAVVRPRTPSPERPAWRSINIARRRRGVGARRDRSTRSTSASRSYATAPLKRSTLQAMRAARAPRRREYAARPTIRLRRRFQREQCCRAYPLTVIAVMGDDVLEDGAALKRSSRPLPPPRGTCASARPRPADRRDRPPFGDDECPIVRCVKSVAVEVGVRHRRNATGIVRVIGEHIHVGASSAESRRTRARPCGLVAVGAASHNETMRCADSPRRPTPAAGQRSRRAAQRRETRRRTPARHEPCIDTAARPTRSRAQGRRRRRRRRRWRRPRARCARGDEGGRADADDNGRSRGPRCRRVVRRAETARCAGLPA